MEFGNEHLYRISSNGASATHRISPTILGNRNRYSSGIHSGLISEYFENGKYSSPELNSWGSPSSDSYPQYPPVYSSNIFPCPKLEKALHQAKLNFNLAADSKWHGLSQMEATLFRDDLTTLSNVIWSDFQRASEKLRKSGQFSCARQESFYEAVSSALEDFIVESQHRDWYKRLRWFVGADTFRHIVNSIAEEQ